MVFANPNHIAPTVSETRRIGDKAALEALIAAWPAEHGPAISTHELADKWLESLAPEYVAEIQAAYPRGLGEYLEALFAPEGE